MKPEWPCYYLNVYKNGETKGTLKRQSHPHLYGMRHFTRRSLEEARRSTSSQPAYVLKVYPKVHKKTCKSCGHIVCECEKATLRT